MFIQPALLVETASQLQQGTRDLFDYIEQACQRIETLDPQLEAMVPESNRTDRLIRQAKALQSRWPDPINRPPLYGLLIGVKDIFRVDGLPTQAGSALPVDLFSGPEASIVTRLKNFGALILGKTVTAQFAYIDPGPTHNPHQLDHTPGGSSSGSAAATAAGYCALALGTQTIGSVLRPAAYCGIVGFKPTYGLIPTDGLIPVSRALDHVGLFTQDIRGMQLAASLAIPSWEALPTPQSGKLPVLGIPLGSYLAQADPAALSAFERHVNWLSNSGFEVRQVPFLDDFEAVAEQTRRLMAVQTAEVHATWYKQYAALYGPRLASFIEQGQHVSAAERADLLDFQARMKLIFSNQTVNTGIDLWISPSATGPAPYGVSASTGNSAMNLPWTLVGFPSISLPASKLDGLPLGLQVVGQGGQDQALLMWSAHIEGALQRL